MRPSCCTNNDKTKLKTNPAVTKRTVPARALTRQGSQMKRTIWLILFGVLVFGGTWVARLPASWALPGPQSGVTCSDVDGTIWTGTCTGLIVQQQAVGDLSWDL